GAPPPAPRDSAGGPPPAPRDSAGGPPPAPPASVHGGAPRAPGTPFALGRLCKPTRGTAATLRAFVEERGLGKVLACGEDAERLAVTLPLTGLLAGVRTPAVGPAELIALAVPRFAAGTTDDPDALAPLYLQPSTPERRLLEGRPS